MSVRVLVAGVSTRAAAESAARAGFDVTSLDGFADVDQHPAVRALSLPRDFHARFTATAAARAARTLACDAVVYASSFENHPNAVRRLTARRMLWGNAPDVLRGVRDPIQLANVFHRNGIVAPAVRLTAATRGQWLVKPVASGGGRRVRSWRGGAHVPAGSYLQEFIDGIPGSVVFVAAAGTVVPLGISRQLVGDRAFGATGFQYCGNILGSADARQAVRLARVVTREFDLVGVNGLDFVVRGRRAYPIEVNPRWSASLELVERAYGLSVFAAHADACRRAALPDFELIAACRGRGAVGKAVVFARHDVRIGDIAAWLASPDVRDVPHPGEFIRAGRPICTVFAAGRDGADCYGALVNRAASIYARTRAWERRVA